MGVQILPVKPNFGTKETLCSPQGSYPVKIRHTSISGVASAMRRVARILMLLALVSTAGAVFAQTSDTIDQIRVIGNRRIPKETILARMFTHPGDTYDPVSIERDFNSLWNTGYFEDLRLEREDSEHGVILDVFVREKPTIRDIIYKGNNSVTNSDILDAFKKEKVGLSVESQYDPTRIKHAENVIKELLATHGHQFATVKTDVKTVPPASVQVTFNIKEGPVVKVGKISFVGNQHL
jgi:outer membrane protein insertion porin family